jgi:protein involved in polysaccharide export with SLBB domain
MLNKFSISIYLFLVFSTSLSAQNFNFPIQPQVFGNQIISPKNSTNNSATKNTPNSNKRTLVTSSSIQKKNMDSILVQRKAVAISNDTAAFTRSNRIFGRSIFTNKSLNFEPNFKVASPQNYIIGPDDELIIDINGYSEEHYSLSVNAEGYIKIPKIGNVYVSGLTIDEAKKRLIYKLSTIYFGLKKSSSDSNPLNGVFASISLGNIKTISVSIQGEVVYPGTYSVSSLSTVMNALYLSGGPNDNGTFRQIQLIRNKKVIASIDLYDYLLNGILKNDITLHDQDIIKVDLYKNRIELTGKVKRRFLFEILPNETLEKIINEFAGGYTDDAFKEQIKITRYTKKERKIIDLNTELAISFLPNTGDIIQIDGINSNRFENKINISGEVVRPGVYSLDTSPTLLKLVERAGGLKENAFAERVLIQRLNPDLSLTNLSVNLGEIINDLKNDIPLKREDLISVYSKLDLKEEFTVTIHGEINFKNESAPSKIASSDMANISEDDNLRLQQDNNINNQNQSEIQEENKSNEANNKLINRQLKLTLPYVENMTVEDLILKAGGLRESAATGLVEIVRRKRNVNSDNLENIDSKIAEVIKIPISDKFQLDKSASKFKLLPFDDVFIRSSPNYQIQQFYTIKGQVIFPGLYGIEKKDERLSDVVRRAGGVNMQAYLKGARLLRKFHVTDKEKKLKMQKIEELQDNYSGTQINTNNLFSESPEIIGINLENALSNPYSDEDLIILDGDELEIPIEPQTIRISGEVLYPTNVKYNANYTFNDYINQAGGITSNSVKRRAYVVYSNGSIDRTRQFLFFKSYPKIEKGSEIIIPQKVKAAGNFQQIASLVAIFTGTISSIIGVVTLIKATAK